MKNTIRLGNFTSSEIYRLMANGKAKDSIGVPAYTYLAEKNMERRLGRHLDNDMTSRPTSWGNLLEPRIFNLLGLEYRLVSTDSITHPTIEWWAGTPDAQKGGGLDDPKKTVADFKCPFTLKSFCELVEPMMKFSGMEAMNKIRDDHKQGEQYYRQIVSNGVLTDSPYGELIVYCPYKSELDEIREMASSAENDGKDLYKYSWINNAYDDDLPWLHDDGYYKNVNILRFEIPLEDKVAMTKRVLEFGKQLIPHKNVVAQ